MSTLANLRTLSELSSWQAGFFTTAQATTRGVLPATLTRLLNAGIVTRPQRGVYRMTAAPANEFEYEEIFATWLATDPQTPATERIAYNPNEAIAAGSLALKLHNDPILHLDRYDFVSAKRRQTNNPKIHYRQRHLTREEVTLARGIPAMTIERAIADLVELNVDLSTIEAVAESQILRGVTTGTEINKAITAALPNSDSTDVQDLIHNLENLWVSR